ncbi:Adenylate cyclase CyaB-like protein [Aix galericulata]|nr:Adenylate cyclase CyaB-like protein [Aix galericulata]
MRRNVELKARLRPGAAAAAARGAAERGGAAAAALQQADTFFGVPAGRLKLRRYPDGRGELIFYERPDTAGPKLSQFSITPTNDPDGLEAVLARALGVLGVVRKQRLLYVVGQTRVHLDSVEGLGDFLELEVVLSEEQSVEHGERVARELMAELGVQDEDLVTGAYLDLLLAKGGGTTP